jgi:hypothetical protein
MTTTYVLGPTNSDITGQTGDFSKQLDDTAVGASTLTWTKPGNGTEQIWGVSQAGVPGAQGVTGDYNPIEFNIITGIDASSTVRVALRRINAAGAAQATSPFTATQLATAGLKTFTHPTVTLGTWAAGDRLVVIYEWAGGSTMSSPVSIQFEVGSTSAEVVAPWTIIPPVSGTLGVTQAGDTLAAAGALGYSGSLAAAQAGDTLAASGTSAAGGVSGTLSVTQASQTLVAAGTSGEPQLIRPTSDRLVGAWTTDTGAASNLFSAVDEAVASFADHIRSENNPTASPVAVRLAALTEPAGAVSDGDVQVRVQYDKEGAATATLIMQLRQGYVSEGSPGTLIASVTDSNVTDAAEDGVISLTAVEHDAIVYTGGVASDLDVRLVAGVT